MPDNKECCNKCGKPLEKDEIALHRKLFNRGATSFMCIDCIGGYLDVPRETLERKIEEFKKMGCTLFQ